MSSNRGDGLIKRVDRTKSNRRLNLKIKCSFCREDAEMHNCHCDCLLTKKKCKCPAKNENNSRSYSPLYNKNTMNNINKSFDLTNSYKSST